MQLRATVAGREGLPSRLGRRLQRLAALGCARLLEWHELAQERRALLALDDRMLKDIGVTRAEAEREASRPFWSYGPDFRSDRPS
jgi:uncharacterized protein YjiS (DUF1127 family)